MPPAAVDRASGDLEPKEDLVARLSASRRNRAGEILIATDGSVKTLGGQRRAAWGIAFDGCSSAFAMHGCDQHIYTAEAWALFQALLMVEQAAAPAIILCDCKSVVQTARRVRRGGRLPLWSAALWKMIANIAPACRILWVPAHDRRPDWKPPDGHSAVKCRELNRLVLQWSGAHSTARNCESGHARRAELPNGVTRRWCGNTKCLANLPAKCKDGCLRGSRTLELATDALS